MKRKDRARRTVGDSERRRRRGRDTQRKGENIVVGLLVGKSSVNPGLQH